MSLSQSTVTRSAASRSVLPHIHPELESCPTCEQPIPHERFEEIKTRIETRQKVLASEITTRLQERFAREKTEALEQARQEAAATLAVQVARARDEERRTAETAANQKLVDAERANKEAQAVLQGRIEQAELAKGAAERAGSSLQAQLDQARLDNEAAVQKVRQEAEANAVAIREEALKKAEEAVQEKLAGMERTRQESEAAFQARISEAEEAKTAALQSSIVLSAQLDQLRAEGEAAIKKVKQEAEARMSAARHEITASVESSMRDKIAIAEQAKADAESKVLASEQQLLMLKTSHEADIVQRLNEQREILERAQTDAVNVERQAAFEKELKLSNKVEELQRSLADKTAEELGEGAEINLYELLKTEFQGDRIERINKGQPGADILHTVIHKGKECGSIIYDSKNHNAWRNEFVTKLASDQMAAKSDHAILSTRKFPAGTRHLHVQDGVILVAPSRVSALVLIVRQHIIATHALRLSEEARTQKTAELYAFINSERFRDLFKRIDTQAEKLLDLQVKEKKAHDATWKTQGELIRSVQKVQAEICNEIDSIIGSANTFEQAVYE